MIENCLEKLEPAQVNMGARERKRETKPGMCSVIQAKIETVSRATQATPRKGDIQE